MGSTVLLHDPASGGNPYGVAWGRTPTVPCPGEAVEVGVRASGAGARVTVEWEADGRRGSAPAEPDGDFHRARLGPFAGAARYRFTVAGGEPTEWFDLPATRWRQAPFTEVAARAGAVEARFGEHVLRCTPAPRALAWRVGPAPGGDDGDGEDRGAPVTIDGWSAHVDAGALHLRGHGRELCVAAPDWLLVDGEARELRLSWPLATGERLYGTGERFDALDQRGRAPDVRVYEQYKQQGTRTYFPVPLVVSSAGYALALDGAARVRFDLGASRADQASVRIPLDDRVAGTFRLGRPDEVLRDHVAASGLPPALPLWAYGPWMSANEWDSEARVREVAERTLAEGIPATVLVIEAWSDETTFYLFNDTDYEPVAGDAPVPAAAMRHGGRWPDPKGLVDWLHAHGMRVVLWQIPALKDVRGHAQHDVDGAHAERHGLCVRTTSGASYRNRGWWFPGARIIDFTNPAARDWWFAKRAWLLDDLGVDGFKTDGGEHLWGDDVVTAAGERGDVAANRYPTHYLSAYHAFLRAHGHDAPVTFSRAGFSGSQAFPAHWAGDEDSTWDAYRASLVAGLSAGLSGVVYWTWDLGGFSGPMPGAELYRRSAAMAAFCPLMQYHSELNERREPRMDRTPWNVAEQQDAPEALDTYRFYARVRMNLVPYLDRLGHEAAAGGLPLLRALVLEAPDDAEAATRDDQFLLGSDLLVAPVLQPGASSRRVYLPAGDWHDLWSARPAGCGWVTAAAALPAIPVFVRAGAAVPLWMPADGEVALGAAAGLPGDGGRLVLMVTPGEETRSVRHPVSGAWFEVAVRDEGAAVVVVADGLADDDVLVWLRGPRAGGGPGAAADGVLAPLSPAEPAVRIAVEAR